MRRKRVLEMLFIFQFENFYPLLHILNYVARIYKIRSLALIAYGCNSDLLLWRKKVKYRNLKTDHSWEYLELRRKNVQFFYDVNSERNVASNVGNLMNYELEGKQKDVVVTDIKIIPRHSPGRLKEKSNIPHVKQLPNRNSKLNS